MSKEIFAHSQIRRKVYFAAGLSDLLCKTLGNFTLEAQLGKGGMGEVYKAKDQKLGRDVAIKVLSEEFSQDSELFIYPGELP